MKFRENKYIYNSIMQIGLELHDKVTSRRKRDTPTNSFTHCYVVLFSILFDILIIMFVFFLGSAQPSSYYYPSPTREEPRRTQVRTLCIGDLGFHSKRDSVN